MKTTGTWIRRGNTIELLDLDSPLKTPPTDHPEGEVGGTRPTLRRGASGSAVRDLQTRLASLGFSPGAADGVFGAGTEGAVRAFQQSRRLSVDGVVGPQTWSALDAGTGGAPAPRPPYVPGGGADGGATGTSASILSAMGRKGYVVYTEPYRLNIVGVRAASVESNSFDDTINVLYKDQAGRWIHKPFPATTDPGSTFLTGFETKEGANRKGVAIVLPGQYPDSHQLGLHRSSYEALVQRGPIKITRDYNKDLRLDFDSDRVETGVYGINIHRASAVRTTQAVGDYSAGCQVFADPQHFAEFIDLCKQHSRLHGNRFTYTLLEQKDLQQPQAASPFSWAKGLQRAWTAPVAAAFKW